MEINQFFITNHVQQRKERSNLTHFILSLGTGKMYTLGMEMPAMLDISWILYFSFNFTISKVFWLEQALLNQDKE